jgi:hypothetical protein
VLRTRNLSSFSTGYQIALQICFWPVDAHEFAETRDSRFSFFYVPKEHLLIQDVVKTLIQIKVIHSKPAQHVLCLDWSEKKGLAFSPQASPNTSFCASKWLTRT